MKMALPLIDATDRLRAGGPKRDIVLGFYHPETRALAGLKLDNGNVARQNPTLSLS